MDELMARTMVESLAKGINPLTGCVLPSSDACANEQVQDALWEVLNNCTIESNEQLLKRLKEERLEEAKQRKQINIETYENYGKPWTKEEIQKLVRLNFNHNIWYTSKVLGRSPKSISSQLNHLGLKPNKRRYKGFK